MGQVNLKKAQKRSLKAFVRKVSNGIYMVRSQSRANIERRVVIHRVDNGGYRLNCTCEWHKNGGEACRHVLAVLRYIAKSQGKSISFWKDEEEARKQKAKVVKVDNFWITTKFIRNTK